MLMHKCVRIYHQLRFQYKSRLHYQPTVTTYQYCSQFHSHRPIATISILVTFKYQLSTATLYLDISHSYTPTIGRYR